MDLATRLSLLQRLKLNQADADWERFYKQYSAVLLGFARKQGMDEHSACDVLQETMMVVIRRLPTFDYDAARGRFRNWLLTIIANKVREARRRSHVEKLISLDAMADDDAESLHDRIASIEPSASEKLEADWRQSLIDSALEKVLTDPRTKPETVAIFRACALEGRPVADIAAQFGMKENAIYRLKNRMMTRLQVIITAMENGEAEPPLQEEE